MDGRPRAIVTLTTEEESIKFMRASEDLELSLDATAVKMIDFADYTAGEPPPKRAWVPDGPWCLLGLVEGPEMEDAGLVAEWTKEVIEILVLNGLKQDPEEEVN
jgi:hypothetical protein